MRLALCVIFTLLVHDSVSPPVTEKKKTDGKETNEVDPQVIEVEYKRYLQEVVQLLENDEDFKQMLLKANPDDIKNGKIADDVEFLNHNVRTKLDELKRQEYQRLKDLAMQQYDHANGIDRKHLKISAHIDANNPHTFEAEDLRKLITQTTKELEEADRERKKEFKEYEMQKELQYQEQLKHMDDENRVRAEKHHEEMQQKHNQHVPIHHPGSRHQLEQVWEEQDRMNQEDFNPKTFFHLHDLDGNGFWDQNEVKALFKKELDKMYDPHAPEDDIKERYEEMERMREHVFNETDKNRDQLISFQEFFEQTKSKEFEEDGWNPIDAKEHPVFNDDEYKRYAQQHEEEIRRMIEQGIIPPAPPGYVPMVIPPDQQHLNIPGVHPSQQQPIYNLPPPGSHPNAIPHGQYGQGQGYNPNVAPQGHAPPQYHPNSASQGHVPPQYHPNVGVPPLNQQQQPQYQHQAPINQQQQQQFHQQNIPPPQQQPNMGSVQHESSTANEQAPPAVHVRNEEPQNKQLPGGAAQHSQ